MRLQSLNPGRLGRYQDRARLQEGKLLLCHKRVIVDTFSVPTLLATPL